MTPEPRRKLSLDVIDVPDPCPEPWDGMKGDDKVRFCGLCEKNVFHLSNMTRDDANELLAQATGEICVRFYRRADGTVVTTDCAPIRFAAMRRLARRTLTGAASMIVALLGLVFSLSLFRLIGFDISSWLEDSAVARIAKTVEPVIDRHPDYEVAGGATEYIPPQEEEPPPPPEDELTQGRGR
ncbi:MAG: hypothetical protein H6719_36390 [Sandaracinaceae bacterium]|nr:hypothetical protein [Sandaracinaceae bacterium]